MRDARYGLARFVGDVVWPAGAETDNHDSVGHRCSSEAALFAHGLSSRWETEGHDGALDHLSIAWLDPRVGLGQRGVDVRGLLVGGEGQGDLPVDEFVAQVRIEVVKAGYGAGCAELRDR